MCYSFIFVYLFICFWSIDTFPLFFILWSPVFELFALSKEAAYAQIREIELMVTWKERNDL